MRLKNEAPAPLAGGYRGRSALGGGFGSNHSSPIDTILPRLNAVRRVARGWIARCPAHEDRSPSLALDVGTDGQTVLLHCFAGCAASEVLAAVGLTLTDLFARPVESIGMRRHERQRINVETGWRGALSTMITESTIIEIAAGDLKRGVQLSEEDRNRLVTAATRIHAAWEVLHGHRRY